MHITKEYLQQELTRLQAQRDQTMANANALAGAVQIVENLLLVLEAPESGSAEVVDLHPQKEA